MALERVYLRRGEEGGLGGTRSRRVAGFVRGVEPREREARDRDATESGERAERGRVRRRAIERPGGGPEPESEPGRCRVVWGVHERERRGGGASGGGGALGEPRGALGVRRPLDLEESAESSLDRRLSRVARARPPVAVPNDAAAPERFQLRARPRVQNLRRLRREARAERRNLALDRGGRCSRKQRARKRARRRRRARVRGLLLVELFSGTACFRPSTCGDVFALPLVAPREALVRFELEESRDEGLVEGTRVGVEDALQQRLDDAHRRAGGAPVADPVAVVERARAAGGDQGPVRVVRGERARGDERRGGRRGPRGRGRWTGLSIVDAALSAEGGEDVRSTHDEGSR